MASPLDEEISPEDFVKRIQQYRPQMQVLNFETDQQRVRICLSPPHVRVFN
jgi:hypothetical protein